MLPLQAGDTVGVFKEDFSVGVLHFSCLAAVVEFNCRRPVDLPVAEAGQVNGLRVKAMTCAG